MQINAQISISQKEKHTERALYSTSLFGVVQDPSLCINDSDEYYLLYQLPFDRSTVKVTAHTKFYLSDTKEGAIQAIKDLISATENLKKHETIDVKDFHGKPFILGYLWTGHTYKITDESISLSNTFGKEYRGASFASKLSIMKKMVKESDKW